MTSKQEYTVITTCSKKKIATPAVYFREDEMFPDQAAMAQEWLKRLRNVPEQLKMPASLLYQGRGFRRAAAVREQLKSSLFIISTGLGMVKPEDAVPSYELTTSSGSNGHVKKHLLYGRFDEVEWWEQLTEGTQPLRRLIEESKGLVLLSISRAYFSMICDELLSLAEEDLQRVRIFGNELEAGIPFELYDYIMPYTQGLNAIYSGGKIDFASRALHHFAEHILPDLPFGSAKEHGDAVFKAMSVAGSDEAITKRGQLDDVALTALVRQEYADCYGRFSRILGVLRFKHSVSCSENRLKRILAEIEKEDSARGKDDHD